MALTNTQRVRILIYDPSTGAGNPDNTTGVGSPNFSDAEIADFLDLYSDQSTDLLKILYASADLCDAMASKAAERSTMISEGGTFVEDSKKLADHWRSNAKQLRTRAATIVSGDESPPAMDVLEIAGTQFQSLDLLGNRLIRELQ